MGRDERAPATHHGWQNACDVIAPDASTRVAKALAARWPDAIGSTPQAHLFFAPYFACFVLFEPDELAVVPLVQRTLV